MSKKGFNECSLFQQIATVSNQLNFNVINVSGNENSNQLMLAPRAKNQLCEFC